jgi:hypothetical protein
MPPRPERRWPGILAGYLILGGFLTLVGTPLYLSAEPADRPTVVRVLVAVALGLALIQLVGTVRRWVRAQPPSAFERALGRGRDDPGLAPIFVTLREEVRFGAASQPYFERVLWPRLLALAARGWGRVPVGWPTKPAGRWLFRRGPSLATLRRLLAEIEEQT